MIVLIEGVDRTGKTTLANWLAPRLDAKVHHFSAPESDSPVQEYVEPFYEGRWVLDRGHIGEVVWPAIFGRPSLYRSPLEFDRVDDFYDARGTLVVHCVRDFTLVANECFMYEEPIQGPQIAEAMVRYQEVLRNLTNLPVIEYDFTRPAARYEILGYALHELPQ